MASPDRVLAVYITGRKWFNRTDVAKFEFLVDLAQDVELTSVAAMLGIAEHLRRSSHAASAGVFVGATA
jgi:hypothetical protein